MSTSPGMNAGPLARSAGHDLNYVSINSALEVDLTGQVDFVRAAGRSPGGASIIALPSAAKGGTLPKIVARLSGPVTTARSDVDVVATEHGAVRLRGMPLRHRVKAMIDLAAPQHREALERQAHEFYGL